MLVIARYGRLRGTVANRIERLGRFAKTSLQRDQSVLDVLQTHSAVDDGGRADTGFGSADGEELVRRLGLDSQRLLERAHAARAELPADTALELAERLLLGERRPVDP